MDPKDPNILLRRAATPTGGFSVERIRIGRVILESVSVSSHEAAMTLTEVMAQALEKTRRRRFRDGETRYAEPLPASAPARLLSVEADDFLTDMERRGLRRGTIYARRLMFRQLLLAAGDIPVSQISLSHVRTFWDVVRWWPSDAGTAKKYRGMTDVEILESGKVANVAAPADASFEGSRRGLASFFNRLLKMRVISHSPMDAFGEAKEDTLEPNKGRAFTDAELQAIFTHDTFLPWASKYPHRWWGPMLGLYTGARVSEIGQLKVGDVLQENGVWCLAFRKTVDLDLVGNTKTKSRQSLKGKSAIRTIPIAQPLLDAGFLDYLEDIRATGHPRLFPHLPAGVCRNTKELNGGGYGVSLTSQFSSYVKKLLQTEKGVGFHAFRHTFITALCEAEVSKVLLATITGHSPRKDVPVMDEHYDHRNPIRLRAKQVIAMAHFLPPVVLPRYTRGQFAKRLRPGSKMHP